MMKCIIIRDERTLVGCFFWVSLSVSISLRFFLLLVVSMIVPACAATHAQESPVENVDTVSVNPISATTVEPASAKSPPSTATEVAIESEPSETKAVAPPPSPPFRLPLPQHAWARFQPGAWRETQTVTETLDEQGNVTAQNLTLHKETLEAVAEGKVVLKVQATVELGGKRIVGETKTRVLHLETDGAGPLLETRRIENRPLTLTGQTIDCEVWELFYQEGAGNLRDVIHYRADKFPHVLRRETFVDLGKPAMEVNAKPADATSNEAEQPKPSAKQPSPAVAEQLIEVLAQQVPCEYGERILSCAVVRNYRHRNKGDSVRLLFKSFEIPGGELAAQMTDFDAQGKVVRRSVTRLLDYAGESVQIAIKPAEPELPVEQPAERP